PIAQGSDDGYLALHLPDISPGSEIIAFHWLAVGPDLNVVIESENRIREHGPESFITRTRNYWSRLVNKQQQDFGDLAAELVDLYKRSLLVLRTQIDYNGYIIAANDADLASLSREIYSYMWPRVCALVYHSQSHQLVFATTLY